MSFWKRIQIMFHNEIIKGTIQFIILALLERGPMHGYGIIRHVQEQTNGEFQWREASLYPALYKLEERKLIRSEWRDGDQGRKRKCYLITEAGRRELASQRDEWVTVSQLVTKLAC